VSTAQDGRRAATIALVAGALGLTLVPLVGAVVAIIAGLLARRALGPGVEGRRQATFGLGLGVLGLLAPMGVIALSQVSGGREAQLEAACRAALDSTTPFTACSELIPDVALSAAFRRLDGLEPTARAPAWATSLRESAICRADPPPPECTGGPPTLEGLLRAMRPLEPSTTRALEAAWPRLLP
jgi:hypothetical protein